MPIFFCANRRCTGNYTSKFSSSKQLVRKTRKTCSQTRLNNLSSNCINSKLLIYSHISACFAVDVLIFASARLCLALVLRTTQRLKEALATTTATATRTPKKQKVYLAKQQLCTCSTLFLYISLPSLHDYDLKMHIMGDVNKRRRIFLSLSKL